MPDSKFESVVKDAKSLTPADQGRLRDLLDAWLNPGVMPQSEDELEQELLREGVLDHIPPPVSDLADEDDWKPVQIEGKPLSETIIEERR